MAGAGARNLSNPDRTQRSRQVGVAADGDAVFTWVRAPSEGVQAWAGP